VRLGLITWQPGACGEAVRDEQQRLANKDWATNTEGGAVVLLSTLEQIRSALGKSMLASG